MTRPLFKPPFHDSDIDPSQASYQTPSHSQSPPRDEREDTTCSAPMFQPFSVDSAPSVSSYQPYSTPNNHVGDDPSALQEFDNLSTPCPLTLSGESINLEILAKLYFSKTAGFLHFTFYMYMVHNEVNEHI